MFRKGFTLLEIIIVITIAAILVAIGATSFTAMRANTMVEERASAARNKLTSWQELARRYDREIYVTFTDNSMTATARVGNDPAPEIFPPKADSNSRTQEIYYLDSSGVSNSGQAKYTMTIRGIQMGTGSAPVTVINNSGNLNSGVLQSGFNGFVIRPTGPMVLSSNPENWRSVNGNLQRMALEINDGPVAEAKRSSLLVMSNPNAAEVYRGSGVGNARKYAKR